MPKKKSPPAKRKTAKKRSVTRPKKIGPPMAEQQFRPQIPKPTDHGEKKE